MKKHTSALSAIRLLTLIGVFFFGSLPSTAFAIDIDFMQSNDILFYDPTGSGACMGVGQRHSNNMSIPSLSGNDNAEKIWNFLKQDGFSDEQAAGLMGNIRQESNYDPALQESNGIGYGIVQWSFGRRTTLQNAASEQGVPVQDLGFQLAYLKQESSSPPLYNWRNLFSNFGVSSNDNVWDVMKKQTTIERATTFFHDAFERSGDYDNYGNIDHRIKFAEEAYEQFTGKSASSSAGSGANCSAAGSGDLAALLLEYAHPTYSEPRYPLDPQPKPAYLETATKLAREGKWVGGGEAEIGVPGIDCGGFVSILLTQSGVEPDYNYGLDLSRGASNQQYGQEPWAKQNWTFLGNGQDINVADLQPGDVAYSDGHTFIYVGDVSGFESKFASASYSYSGRRAGGIGNDVSWRAPMAAGSWDGGAESATNPMYRWYGRRSGTPPAYGTTRASWSGGIDE